MKTSLVKLFVTVLLLGATSTIFMSVMPDYLSNELGVDGEVRGALEVPRELPGFLLVFIAGFLVRIRRKKAIAMVFLVGILAFLGLAFFTDSLLRFIFFMVIWSSAMHAFIPLRDTTAIELAGSGKRGWVLGRVGAYRSLGLILGTAVVWVFLSQLKTGFKVAWIVGAILLIPGVFVAMKLPSSIGEKERGTAKRFVFRKKYRLFYWLCMLFGARKQIFLTFAPWLLVSVYHQKAPQLALAMGASALIGIFLKPVFGKLIDKLGERTILMADAALILLLSSAYAVIPQIAGPAIALALLYCFFVMDELLFSLSMARTTYLSRIIENKSEMVPTIGLGGTIDHIVSMVVPVIGGILWMKVGPWSVFAMAGFVAAITFFTVSTMEK
ncbi:MAG: MFS transporter [Candidatus Fermentibacteria bacterium]|nr:MFS transporter [Candidatus Fermentibacteria bacterium]